MLGTATGGLMGVIAGLRSPYVTEELTANLRRKPGDGFRHSLRNALIGGAWCAALFILLDLAATGTIRIAGATAPALVTALFAGGLYCIQNVAIRWRLSQTQLAPFKYVQFLDEACERVFLRRVDGGYMFVHRLLMEHLAGYTNQVEDVTAAEQTP
jgi:hypothetical protein